MATQAGSHASHGLGLLIITFFGESIRFLQYNKFRKLSVYSPGSCCDLNHA